MKAIKSNKSEKGTTLTTIMDMVKADIESNSAKGKPRNLSFLVKKALLRAVQNGTINYKYRKYHLTPLGNKMYYTKARRGRGSKRGRRRQKRSRSRRRHGSKGRRRRRSRNRASGVVVEKADSLGSTSSKTDDAEEWVDFPSKRLGNMVKHSVLPQLPRKTEPRRPSPQRSRSRSTDRSSLLPSREETRKRKRRSREVHDGKRDGNEMSEGKQNIFDSHFICTFRKNCLRSHLYSIFY